MRLPKIRELVEAITALVKGPYTSRFPYAPHEPAKRFRGKPEYSNEGCIACAACALVCPARAIEFRDAVTKEKATRKMVLHLDECHYCGQCSALCTTRDDNPPGIRHTTKFDLAGFDRREMVSTTDEKELALCESCGDVIAAKAHLDWVARKLGPLAFSNPTLFLSSLEEMGIAEGLARTARDYALRSDRIKILCAKCKRKATLERY
ncbi:MAG: 4Fe-4S dicluster domain-containing protein [Candidatus Omnitrophica bacterium]|nr:4Fe-4S dicluster domain-containing protein [Candidatus Omnitrophota bacterium]MDD5436434.1 4Fe-4S dicluster domain-containing protein [Candidatus Omnitrophota bacterium]